MEAVTEQLATGAFSMELSQDQRDLRDWVHGFAEKVVRPAAAEWDEREETPWPLIQEAAKIGLYSFEALAQFYADETGLLLPIVNEELFWGDAGIGMAIMGTTLAVAGIFSAGTPEQLGEWVPQCYGTVDEPQVGAFCVSEPDAGSDVSSLRTRARYDEASDEWVLNGQKAWATNGGIAEHPRDHRVCRARSRRARPGRLHHPAQHAGLTMGTKVKKHGLRASHTADVFLDDCRIPGRCVLGGKEKLDERLARAREGTRARKQAAMQTFEATRPTVGAQAIGIARAAYEYSLAYAKERTQFGARSSRIRRSRSRSRTWRWRSTPRGCSSGARRGWPDRPRVQARRGLDEQLKANEVAMSATSVDAVLGCNGYTREYRVERMHRDTKIYTIFEGTSESSGSSSAARSPAYRSSERPGGPGAQ